MKSHHIFTLLATTLLTASASGTTMTFEGVISSGDMEIPVSPYTENGFTLTASNPDNGIFSPTGGPDPRGGFTSDYFTFNGPTTSATLTSNSADPFSLNSLDIGIGAAALPNASLVDVTLTGNLFGGGTVSTTINSVSTVSNYSLNWTNLASVVITGTDDPGIDNIVLNEAQGVPDGGTTVLMLGLGLFGMAGMKRKLRRS